MSNKSLDFLMIVGGSILLGAGFDTFEIGLGFFFLATGIIDLERYENEWNSKRNNICRYYDYDWPYMWG